MDEAQRFLRYILPGVIFLIEVFIALVLLDPAIMKKLKSLATVGGILTLVVSSGGIGALLSMLYFFIFRRLCKWGLYINHVPLLKDSVIHERLKITLRETREAISLDLLTPEAARRIVTALWAEFKDRNTIGEAVNSRARSLLNIVHGFGATLLGSLIAFILPAIKYSCVSEGFSLNFVYIILSTFFIIAHLGTYITTFKHTNGVIGMLFCKALEEEKKNSETAEIFISSADIPSRNI